MGWAEKAIELAKKAAASDAGKTAGKKAAEAAAGGAGALGASRYRKHRERKQDYEKATSLARQISGQYSENTIVDGEPRFVV